MALDGWEGAQITITIPAQAAVLEEFPVLVHLSAASGTSAANVTAIFDSLEDNKYRIAAEDVATGAECPIEVERWDAAARAAQLWIKVPSISAASATTIRIWYDPAHADNTTMVGEIGSAPAVAVWDAGYEAVYHLSQDPSGTIKDSTSHARHATSVGSMTSAAVVDGIAGQWTTFDGVNDGINCGFATNFNTFTLETFFYTTGIATGRVAHLISKTSYYATAMTDFPVGLRLTEGEIIELSLDSGNGDWVADLSLMSPGSYAGMATSAAAVDDATGSASVLYANGSQVATGAYVNPSDNARNWYIGKASYDNSTGATLNQFNGMVRTVRISSVARSAAWLAAAALGDRDQLVSFSGLHPVVAALVGNYSLVMEQAFVGRYGDAATITAGIVGRYGNAATIQAALVGRYNDMVPVLAAIEGRYHLMHSVLAGLEGEYAICGTSVLAALDGRYDLRERNEIMAALVGYYSVLPGATIQQIVCPVRIGGVSVRWSSVSWTRSEDNYLIEATVVLRDPAEFGSIAKLDTVEIDWAGTTYTLFVSAKLRARSVSGDPGAAEYGADYTIIARSLTAGLDAPYALPVTMSWPATTLASSIAADLIASQPELITLDFRLEDWPQPGGTFFLTDESPLDGLRKLAAIIGGIVQTSPSNALILRMADPTPPAEYDKVVPAWTIEDSGLFSDSESESESNRYNVITVSNQGESDQSTRFEIEDITEYRKRVRGYRVPWVDFGLATSGGSWVTIEDGGVVEEPVVDDVVEFVDGSASAPLPVYSMVSVVWLQASLGAITAAEDGSLTSEVVGNSLAKISYTTRCHMWIGTSDRSEEVQFYEVEK